MAATNHEEDKSRDKVVSVLDEKELKKDSKGDIVTPDMMSESVDVVESKKTALQEEKREQQPQNPVTPDELCSLIRAIKFAYPDYGIRRVHREIVEVCSLKESLLGDVRLGDVKKIWKDATASPNGVKNGAELTEEGKHLEDGVGEGLCEKNDEKGDDNGTEIDGSADVFKFYTIGNGAVKTLTDDYNSAAQASAANVLASSSVSTDVKLLSDVDSGWTHAFLDVAMDRSGTKPHQALINFSQNATNGIFNNTSSQTKKQNKKNKGKKKGKGTAAGASATSPRPVTSTNDRKQELDKSSAPVAAQDQISDSAMNIVKIQMAAGLAADSNTPMLLYNNDRSARTFLHPSACDGFERIQSMLVARGEEGWGSLGPSGGVKGYFYAKVQEKEKLVSIKTTVLAPDQPW
eukprot:CAMPEP_0194400324 /NCGR_PEP_ID=MMETSP0174-20130528/127147_1 /TAXON_ID=216777 /ORGANISM="Proboscia alata, Strain PI-D3" /LENGTH=404 /DNA_ID=CAMNT_0039196821 /DNA_START=42 /DNA_END=1253 /DNA_ORIENTATION=+